MTGAWFRLRRVHLSAFEQNVRDLNRLKKKDHLLVTPDGYAVIGPIAWLAFNTRREPNRGAQAERATSHAVTLLALFGYSAPVFRTGIMLIIGLNDALNPKLRER